MEYVRQFFSSYLKKTIFKYNFKFMSMMKTKLMRQIIRFLLFIFFVMLVSIPVAVLAQPSGEVYVYSFPKLRSSEILSSYFNNKPDWKVILYNLNDSASMERFLNITKTLTVSGVSVIPPDLCVSCELKHLAWDEILTSFGSPLIGFFRNGRLTAITIAVTDYKVLDQALMVDVKNGVKILTSYKSFTLTDEDIRIQLEGVFITKQEENADVHTDIFYFYR